MSRCSLPFTPLRSGGVLSTTELTACRSYPLCDGLGVLLTPSPARCAGNSPGCAPVGRKRPRPGSLKVANLGSGGAATAAALPLAVLNAVLRHRCTPDAPGSTQRASTRGH